MRLLKRILLIKALMVCAVSSFSADSYPLKQKIQITKEVVERELKLLALSAHYPELGKRLSESIGKEFIVEEWCIKVSEVLHEFFENHLEPTLPCSGTIDLPKRGNEKFNPVLVDFRELKADPSIKPKIDIGPIHFGSGDRELIELLSRIGDVNGWQDPDVEWHSQRNDKSDLMSCISLLPMSFEMVGTQTNIDHPTLDLGQELIRAGSSNNQKSLDPFSEFKK